MTISLNQHISPAVIELPASKSISHRAMIIEYMTPGCKLYHCSEAHDTKLMQQSLVMLREQNHGVLDMQDAGTPARFLLALLAVSEGKEFIFTGTKRLQERPMADLINALRSLGASITALEHEDGLPLQIKGRVLHGGEVSINTGQSSQFISALCLIAPLLSKGLDIHLQGNSVSASYIQMTTSIMRQFGIHVTSKPHCLTIPPASYTPREFTIEADWSSASFFFAMAIMLDECDIRLRRLTQHSIQGDAYVVELAKDFGIETLFTDEGCTLRRTQPIERLYTQQYDMTDYPDLAVPIIVACAVTYPLVTFTGIAHLELKESKRISALQEGLSQVGINVVYENEVLQCEGNADSQRKEIIINTHQDHRIAMSMSLLALKGFRVTLHDGDCVRKSFPDYFQQLHKLGFDIAD